LASTPATLTETREAAGERLLQSLADRRESRTEPRNLGGVSNRSSSSSRFPASRSLPAWRSLLAARVP